MDTKIIQAQRELIQGYYNKIVLDKPDIETILNWLEADLEYIRMETLLSEAETILTDTKN